MHGKLQMLDAVGCRHGGRVNRPGEPVTRPPKARTPRPSADAIEAMARGLAVTYATLGWEWHVPWAHVPTAEGIGAAIYRLLERLGDDPKARAVSSGGLTVEYGGDNDAEGIYVSFSLPPRSVSAGGE